MKTKNRYQQSEGLRKEISELLAGTAWEGIGLGLLLFASISMLSVFSDVVRLGAADAGKLIFVLFVIPGWYRIGRRLNLPGLVLYLPVPVFFIALLGFYAAHGEKLRTGLFAIASQYFTIYNRIYGTVHIFQEQAPEEISGVFLWTVLLIFLAFYFLAVLGRSRLLFVVLPIFSAGLLMCIQLSPRWGQIAIAALGGYMLFRVREKAYADDWMAVVLVGTLVCLTGFLGAGKAKELLVFTPKAKGNEAKIENKIEDLFSGVISLDDGRVSNHSPRYHDTKVMTIRTDELPSENLYFRNYYGVSYAKGKWMIPEEDFSSVCAENAFDTKRAALLLAGAISKSGAFRETQFQVQYRGLFDTTMLLPYGVDYEGIGEPVLTDIAARRKLSQRKITFEAAPGVSFTPELLKRSRDALLASYQEDEKEFWNRYGEYVRRTCLDVSEEIADTFAYQNLSAYFKARSFSKEEEKLEKARMVSFFLRGFNVFDEVLGKTFQVDFRYDWNLDPLSGEDPVLYFLNESHTGYCVHFASAGVLLLRSLGVPARFASGYVVKLSAFEKQEDGSYLAEVIDRNAHAWAEIYLDDIGWVPVEMTAGYESITVELPTSKEEVQKRKVAREEKAAKEKEASKAEEEPEKEEASKAEEEPEKEEASKAEEGPGKEGTAKAENGAETEDVAGTKDASEKGYAAETETGERADTGKARQLVHIFLFLLILSGLLWMIRWWYKDYHERLSRAIMRRDYRRAVMMMNRRVYRRLKRKGFKRGCSSDREFEKELIAEYGEECREEITEYMRVVREAAFSSNRLTREDCMAVKRLYGRKKKRD